MNKKIDSYKKGDTVNGVVFIKHVSNGSRREAIFLCVKCNIETKKRFSNVKSGNSCMCKKCACKVMRSKKGLQKRNPKLLSLKKEAYRSIKKSARKRLKIFNLSYSFVINEIVKPCKYCGCKPNTLKENYLFKFYHHGLDRVDNDIGYIEDNVVSCCKTCNLGKNTLKLNEWLNHLDNLVKYRLNNNLK